MRLMNCPTCQTPLLRAPGALGRLAFCERCGRAVSAVENPPAQESPPAPEIVEAHLVPAPTAVHNASDRSRLDAEALDVGLESPSGWTVLFPFCKRLAANRAFAVARRPPASKGFEKSGLSADSSGLHKYHQGQNLKRRPLNLDVAKRHGKRILLFCKLVEEIFEHRSGQHRHAIILKRDHRLALWNNSGDFTDNANAVLMQLAKC